MLREYVCARITKKKGRKFVIHFHCTIPNTTNGKFAWFLLKKLCKISDMIFVLNSQSQTCLNKITNTPIKTIPNFVNENEIVESRRINNDLKTVLYVGGIIESKGISDILKTAQRMPELSFRLIGEGENCFKDYALKSNLNNVIFTGPKDKNGVIDELKNADVFLFLSHFDGEGFSVALTEAMASGLPCIVTDWAANADMIGENGGVITKVGDIDAVVNAFNMIKPYNVRKKQSEANIQKVMLCYNDKVVLDMFVDAYEEMLTKKYE
ncbi:MAG: glycosyltransferase [Oscillospiraceae bacterium]|nr:glycosyltransferase [Candidatus Equicaccousia limihippi]